MGARVEALDEEVLAAASKSTEYFFAISIFLEVRCIGCLDLKFNLKFQKKSGKFKIEKV